MANDKIRLDKILEMHRYLNSDTDMMTVIVMLIKTEHWKLLSVVSNSKSEFRHHRIIMYSMKNGYLY